MIEEKREVNVDEEPKNDEAVEETVEEADEEIIPADPLGEKSKSSDETTPESSPEEKEESPLKEAKPVEGETLKERALRKEIERLRAEKRQGAVQVVAPKEQDLNSESKSKLEELGYSEDEIDNMTKVIDILAEQQGYVKKSHTYQESINQVLSDFIEEHPIYKPANDKNDEHWARFQQILSNDYNIIGKNPKQVKAVFEKVHRDIAEEFGDVEDEDKKLNAQTQKIRSVSHGGGTKTNSNTSRVVDPAVKAMFKDFDDDDLI
jgi:hypothetical protein